MTPDSEMKSGFDVPIGTKRTPLQNHSAASDCPTRRFNVFTFHFLGSPTETNGGNGTTHRTRPAGGGCRPRSEPAGRRQVAAKRPVVRPSWPAIHVNSIGLPPGLGKQLIALGLGEARQASPARSQCGEQFISGVSFQHVQADRMRGGRASGAAAAGDGSATRGGKVARQRQPHGISRSEFVQRQPHGSDYLGPHSRKLGRLARLHAVARKEDGVPRATPLVQLFEAF